MEAIFSLERNLLEWSYVVKSHGSVKKRTWRRQCRRAFGSSPEDDGLVGQVQVFISCVELCGYGCQLSREVVWWPTTGKLTFALSIKYGGILPGYILS